MNERLMQFRIGMFVIVAGLVLTMMIVWFGESPSILRDQVYLKVHYAEAPGVVEGVPVRKSGIRIGEVFATTFDERPNEPDGVIVTLALERRYKLHEGTVPRLNRSLIGDVTVDMMPGTGQGFLATSKVPALAPVIQGEVAPDPSKALAAATKAFESAGDTLKAINEAAAGLSEISKSAAKLDDFLASVADAGRNVSKVAQGIERVIKTNEGDLQPTMANLRQIAQQARRSHRSGRAQDRHRAVLVRLGPARCRPRPDRPDPQGPERPGQPPAGHRYRPGRPANQSRGRRSRAPLQQAAQRPRRSQHRRKHPEAAHPGGAARQLQRDGDLGHPDAGAAQDRLEHVRSFIDKVSRDPSLITPGRFQSR